MPQCVLPKYTSDSAQKHGSESFELVRSLLSEENGSFCRVSDRKKINFFLLSGLVFHEPNQL